MRRLLSAIVALTVSSGVVSADNVVLPVKCVGTNSGFAVRTGIVATYAIVGPHKERDHKICASGKSGDCKTLKIHKFDVDCDGQRVAYRELAGAMIRARGAVARTSKGSLNFRLVEPSFASLNPVCTGDRFSPDKVREIQRWSLDSSCGVVGFAPRKTVKLPVGFAPLAELGGRILTKSDVATEASDEQASVTSVDPSNVANTSADDAQQSASPSASTSPPDKSPPDNKTLTSVRRIEVRTAGQAPRTQSNAEAAPRPVVEQLSAAAMALPGESLTEDGSSIEKGPKQPATETGVAPRSTLLPRTTITASKVTKSNPQPNVVATPAVVAPQADPRRLAVPKQTIEVAAAAKATAATREQAQTVQVAATSKSTVVAEATSPSSWNTLVEVVNRRTGEPSARQQVQHSMVATILGLALVTSLVSGIGWFATQQLLVARKSKSDPYQLILKREVTDLAKPDAQMCGELCRTGQSLIGDIHTRVDQIQGAAALRRVLTREVRSMEQFLSATIQSAPEDPREWRRTRLRLQRVVTDLIRLKDITDGARRSLTSKLISDELPRDKQEAYEMLGANAEASEKILKRLVDALRATWHPDLATNEDDLVLRNRRIKQINVAWDLITEKRGEA